MPQSARNMGLFGAVLGSLGPSMLCCCCDGTIATEAWERGPSDGQHDAGVVTLD